MTLHTGAPSAPASNRYGRMCAEVYDLDKPVGSLHDTAFHVGRLAGVNGPVLEAPVGSGRLLIPLLEAGIDADGFDHSEPMLTQCRARCEARGLSPRLWRAGFADFETPRAYAAVVIATGSFLFAGGGEAGRAVLRRCHGVLAPGGVLRIDLPSLSFLTEGMAGVRAWTSAEGDLLRLTSRDVDVDWVAQTRTTHDVYERFRDGRLVETELEVMRYRAWAVEELTAALRDVGFGEVEVFGGYRPGRPPRTGDRVITWEARR